MSVKGFTLKDGTKVNYDYRYLDNIDIDNSLTRSGVAADAKVVGDEIADLKQEIADLKTILSNLTE